MRILQLSPRLPFPLTEGGSIGIFNITRQLSRRGAEIHFVALTSQIESGAPDALRNVCKGVLLLERKRKYGIKLALRNSFSSVPINVEKYHSEETLRQILRYAEGRHLDLIHVDHLHMAYYGLAIAKSLRVPVVLREHNLELKVMERVSKSSASPWLRAYARIQSRKFLKYEPLICSQFDRCVMITEEDKSRLVAMNEKVSASVIPAGVDTECFRPSDSIGDQNSIAYIGSLDWLPNVEAVKWFVSGVLPRVLRIRPEAKFYIYGKNATSDVRRLHNGRNVVFRGFVEDVREVFNNARVVVVPLLVGSGMRIKILEAMAAGKPVVTTSIGCEGIRATENQNIMIGDTYSAFADKIIELLGSESLCRRVGQAAASFASQNYSWDKVGEMFWQTYVSLVHTYDSSRMQTRGE